MLWLLTRFPQKRDAKGEGYLAVLTLILSLIVVPPQSQITLINVSI